MHNRHGPTAGLSCLALLGFLLAVPGDDEAETYELRYDDYEDWEFVLPDERWTQVEREITLSGGVSFATEPSGSTGALKLWIDTDGDGDTDEKVQGIGGFTTLRGETADGEDLEYAVRLRCDGRNWHWAAGGAMEGRVAGEHVKIIDQNGNGRYDDFGADALIVGRGEAASFLSRVVNLDDELYELDVTADGREVTLRPFGGESGVVNAEDEFDIRGDLVAAVIVDGQRSFNLAGFRDGLRVPVGDYELVYGYAVRSTESVQMRGGKMRAIEVRAGGELELQWGGPVTAEFDYELSGNQITVSEDVRFYGRLGEEYHTFKPNAKSPKILIYEKGGKRLIRTARFGGC